jgi:pimeloyl-ACP methyl ester carboxylesterase
MEQFYQISYRQSLIGYYVAGSGTHLLFCFQGYGESSNQFRVLYPLLCNRYKLISVALPFHDGTDWKEGLDLQPQEWATILLEIKKEEEKRSNTIFPLMSITAFSMGGRVAFHLIGQEFITFSQAVLIAPDGLRVNPWYYLATQTTAGNKFFKYTMQRPGWLFALMVPVLQLGILPDMLIKFARRYLDNAQERNLLYLRWTTLRHFKADQSSLIRAVNKGLKLTLVFGQFDPIILRKRAAGLEKTSKIKVVEIKAGHQLIKEKYARELAACFES